MAPGTNYQPMLNEAAPPETPEIQLSGGRRVQPPSEPIRRRNIIKSIEREFGNRIYTGRIKGKTMLGFHRKPNNEIRTKRNDDLEVTAHELAHWLDDRYQAFGQVYRQEPYASELKGISYDASKVHEGFAEFSRLYMTQEAEARHRAPRFFERFQQLLEETNLTSKVNNIQEEMHAWYYQGAKSRLASKMGQSQSIRQRLDQASDRATDRFVTQMLDGLQEIAVAEKDLQGYVADATRSPYKAWRLVAGARGAIKSIFHYGTIGWGRDGDIKFTGKSLEDVFAPISDNLENAKLYFIARRAQELKSQGRENLIENDEIRAGLQEGENDPRLKEAFDEFQAFNSRMMDFYEDSGIISSDSRAAMEEANKNYVPFHRIMESLMGDEQTRVSSGFQRLRGGTSNLGDIFENIEQSVSTLTRTALINRAKQLSYDMVDRYPGGSYYAVKIPKESRPVQVAEEDLVARIVPGFGITASQYRAFQRNGEVPEGHTPQSMETISLVIDNMASMENFTTFFQHGQEPRGDNIDSLMRGGEIQYYEIGDPLWQIAMSHFGPKNVNMALRIAGGFANTLRRGVTSMPSFLIPNLVRDGSNAILFSRGGWKGRIPFAGAVKGWSDAISRDSTYWEFMANGGGFSSTVHGEVEQSVARFYQREGINYDNVLDTPRKFLDKWDSVTSAFEYGTRLGEFRQVRQEGGSRREAALAGREISTDFSMHGASQTMAALRMSVPFFNTRIQGLYKIVREAGATKERNGSLTGMSAALAIRGISLLTIPSLALWAWNNMDDERREKYQSLPNWVRDMHWVIYIPGKDQPFLLPKPFEVGAMFGSIPERMADAAVEGDGQDLGPSLYWIMAEQLNLAPMPQVFNPVYEDMTNENFLDMPVIPPDLQNVKPVEQFKPWTSDTAIAIGNRLGVSPMKVEHYLRGYFGTLGAQALAVSDIALHDEERYGDRPEARLTDYPVVRRFVGKSPQTSTRQQKEWYEFMQSVRSAKTTIDKIVSESRNPEAYIEAHPEQERLAAVSEATGYQSVRDTINDLQAAMERVRTSKALNAEAKREQLDELQRQLNEVYREGSRLAERVSIQTQ